jgi:hypothetical protein
VIAACTSVAAIVPAGVNVVSAAVPAPPPPEVHSLKDDGTRCMRWAFADS